MGLTYHDQQQGQRIELPLEGVHVSARVVNFVCEVQVVQFFYFPASASSQAVDCVYDFPLDEKAAVCGFEVELADDKLIVGRVLEKQAAKRVYDTARQHGQTAGLLQEDKPDVFRQQIANCRPNTRINVRLTYVSELAWEADTRRMLFVFPTSVAPRYSPKDMRPPPLPRPWHEMCWGRRLGGRQSDETASKTTWDGKVESLPFARFPLRPPTVVVDRERPCRFSLCMETELASNILSIEPVSRQHELHTEISNTTATTWFAATTDDDDDAGGAPGTHEMGKDLVIAIRPSPTTSTGDAAGFSPPTCLLELADDNDAEGQACAMLTFVPEFDLDPEQRAVCFVLDCSGSMQGDRIQASRVALHILLQSLPASCTFNIYRFGSTYVSLFPEGTTQQYSQRTLEAAKAYVDDEVRADLGGTELLPVLRAVFRHGGNSQKQVFVLTDGQVTNTEQVIGLVRANSSAARVFTLGIGDEVSRHLVHGMARAGNGTAEFIATHQVEEGGGGVEAKLVNQLKMATLPSITDIDIDWGVGEVVVAPAATAPTTATAAAPRFLSNFFPTPQTTAATAAASPHAVKSGRAARNAPLPLRQAPFLPPPLFTGTKFLCFAFIPKLSGGGEFPHVVRITAKVPGSSGEMSLQVPVTRVKSLGRSVHVLAARALIRDLAEESSYVHLTKQRAAATANQYNITQRAQEEMISVALQYQLVSPCTSFVAVERGRDGKLGSTYASSGPPEPMRSRHEDLQPLKYKPQSFASAGGFKSAGFGGSSSRSAAAATLFNNDDDEEEEDLESLCESSSSFSAKRVVHESASSWSSPMDLLSTAASSFFSAPPPPPPPPPGGTGRPMLLRGAAAPAPPAAAPMMTPAAAPMMTLRAAAPSAQKKSAAPPAPTTTTTVHSLLHFQQFDGSFSATMSPELAAALKTTPRELTDKANRVKHLFHIRDPSVCLQIATAVGFLQALRRDFAASKSTWDMSAEKTKAWVVAQLCAHAVVNGGGMTKPAAKNALQALLDLPQSTL